MEKIEKLLKQFGTLQEFTDFLGELVEADGSEISRGKDPNDKSKIQKETEREEEPAEVPVGGEGGEMMGAEEPIIDPVQAPGSQVAIGNKDTNDADDPKTTKIEMSGKKEKINLKPKIEVDSSSLK